MDKWNNKQLGMLNTLEDTILSDGFSHLTVAELARQLRCSRRTIYELAPSKDKLVLMLLDSFFTQIREDGVKALEETDDPKLRIYNYLQVGVGAAEKMSPVLVADIDNWSPARKMWGDHIRARTEGLKNLIKDGIESGAFKDHHAYLVAETMFASIQRIREPDFSANSNLTLGDALREFYSMILDALIKDTGDGKRQAKPAKKKSR